jgi:hypothetical protein
LEFILSDFYGMLPVNYSYGDEIHFGSRKLLGTAVIFCLRVLDLSLSLSLSLCPATTNTTPSSGFARRII